MSANTGPEKNWLWFFHNGELHLLYQADPHTIIRFNEKYEQVQTYETTTEGRFPWDYGIPRGGTPPVLAGDGNEYWTYFHSSLPTFDKYRRRYYMGAYAFEASPPFRITKITPEPILAGSSCDPWDERKPLVVFPCGSILKDDSWTITMGINDLSSAWARIPHEDIEERCVRLYNPPKRTLGSILGLKPKVKDVTLVCIDDRKPHLAQRAMDQCTERLAFEDVKFFTSHTGYRRAVKIPPIRSLEEYSRFIIKDLADHIKTSHCLIVQWDGYVIDPAKWKPEFLNYDYVGAPWITGGVGNGGFSLRSRKLLKTLQADAFTGPFMPEDQNICRNWRATLETEHKITFAPPALASMFSVENGVYTGQFGFHSFITKLPTHISRPKVFHHSGDYGDMIYGLAAIRAAGGGVLYVSDKTQHELRQRQTQATFSNIESLLNVQEYIWRASWTGEKFDPDYDLNRFRDNYVRGKSLLTQQCNVVGEVYDETQPWLKVDFAMAIPGKQAVVSRSGHYHNSLFPWKNMVKQFGKRMVFVGLDDEYDAFIKSFGEIDRVKTPTLLDVARLIQGTGLFIGNQSAPMSIALGLGARVIQETWDGPSISLGDLDATWDGKGDANCILNRPNAIYCTGGQVDIPKGWL